MLTVGQTFNNYSELCLFLKQKPTTGEAKANQLKNWETYFEYKLIKRKWVITQVYKDFTEIPERERKPREGIFLEASSIILLDFLARRINPEHQMSDTCNTVILQISEAIIEFGFCNESYGELKNSSVFSFLTEEEFDEHFFPEPIRTIQKTESFSSLMQNQSLKPIETFAQPKINPNLTSFICRKYWTKVNDILKSTLKSLAKRHFITFDYTYLIITDKDNPLARLASLEETNSINEATLEASEEPRFKNVPLKVLYTSHYREDFLQTRKLILKGKGIYSCKRVYAIAFTAYQLSIAESYKCSKASLTKAKAVLNKQMNLYMEKYVKRKSDSLLNEAFALRIITSLHKTLTK